MLTILRAINRFLAKVNAALAKADKTSLRNREERRAGHRLY